LKVLSVLLAAFLIAIQGQLWFGKGGVSRVVQLESQLAAQKNANKSARARNDQLEAELRDLREGQEMVEEKARSELGMVKPDEIYVQVIGAPRTAASAAATGQR
jgi:cell division protein FtsB